MLDIFCVNLNCLSDLDVGSYHEHRTPTCFMDISVVICGMIISHVAIHIP